MMILLGVGILGSLTARSPVAQRRCFYMHKSKNGAVLRVPFVLSYFRFLLEHGREVIFLHKSRNAVAISKSSDM